MGDILFKPTTSSRPSTAGANRNSTGNQQSLANLVQNSQGPLPGLTNTRPSTAGISRPNSTASLLNETVKLGTPTVPKFIANEKQVLRFYGYFSTARNWEADMPLGVPAIESEMVRFLTICYYLDDNTIEMREKNSRNSGS